MTEASGGARWAGPRWRRAAKGFFLSITLTATSVGSYYAAVQYGGNIHTVTEGRLYRSAQLKKPGLERVVKEYGIRSIVSLRGASRGRAWYEEEIAVSEALGVAHYDYGISARQVVTAQQIAEILEILRMAPKPILLHCEAGADRTGLVAALYRVKVEGVSVETAAEQLSLLYGHFPYLGSRTRAMDESFWRSVHGP